VISYLGRVLARVMALGLVFNVISGAGMVIGSTDRAAAIPGIWQGIRIITRHMAGISKSCGAMHPAC